MLIISTFKEKKTSAYTFFNMVSKLTSRLEALTSEAKRQNLTFFIATGTSTVVCCINSNLVLSQVIIRTSLNSNIISVQPNLEVLNGSRSVGVRFKITKTKP